MQSSIRNFCIIAHIDHGKSTLADRLLEYTKTLTKREMKNEQMMDTMDLEQERGITIKLQPARMLWEHSQTWKEYMLNLIDTPGHVDFQYEVSRSLAACEGAILLVDATQGIEAQTLSNVYMAIEQDLEIIPVINKIDLPNADADKVAQEIEDVFGISAEDCLYVSGKTGMGVPALLDTIIDKIPEPSGSPNDTPRALIFDSLYDPYQGVIAYVRVVDGTLKKWQRFYNIQTQGEGEILEIGYLRPAREPDTDLATGEIGYVVTGLKDVSYVRVGDTMTLSQKNIPSPLPGYKPAVPMVFAGMFPMDAEDYPALRDTLEKLRLSDSSLVYEPENSVALGFGFRSGFLGLLHMDIIKERISREYDIDVIVTAPTVRYKVVFKDGEQREFSNPSEFPEMGTVESIEEPWARVEIIVPEDYIGQVMSLCEEKHGIHKSMQYIDTSRVNIVYELPVAGIVTDFYDKLKSGTSGYASMSYEELNYRIGDLVKLDILISGDRVDALSVICHKDDAYHIGVGLVEKLKELIPRQMFPVPLQGAIGGRIIARETISAYRKDVTAKLYGGDVSRKKKLLEKQKEWKKRMKTLGKVDIPQDAFLAILKK